MLHIEHDGENRVAVSASGDFEERHVEMASLICILGNEAEQRGMDFNKYILFLALTAKSLRNNSITLDTSILRKFMDDLDTDI